MRAAFEQPREGRSFPLHEVLAELAAAVTLVRAALEWVPKLRAALGREPTASEVMDQTGDCGVEQQRAEQVINKVLDA